MRQISRWSDAPAEVAGRLANRMVRHAIVSRDGHGLRLVLDDGEMLIVAAESDERGGGRLRIDLLRATHGGAAASRDLRRLTDAFHG